MSVVIDQVEKEISKTHKTHRKNAQYLIVYASDEKSRCEITTKDLRSFECKIFRNHPTIANKLYSSEYIIKWIQKSL